jgi:hypothetical protein
MSNVEKGHNVPPPPKASVHEIEFTATRKHETLTGKREEGVSVRMSGRLLLVFFCALIILHYLSQRFH